MFFTIIAALTSVTLACNTPEELRRDLATPFNSHNGLGSILRDESILQSRAVGPIVKLPQTGSNTDPAALDGSPYAFYFVPSTTGSTQWTISIEGGGWCYDETLCYARSKTKLGTSTVLPSTSGCNCMNTDANGPVSDCNCLYMPYLDGASFSGYRAEPWPVPNTNGSTLTFRGIKNIDATLQWAFERGLATNRFEVFPCGRSRLGKHDLCSSVRSPGGGIGKPYKTSRQITSK